MFDQYSDFKYGEGTINNPNISGDEVEVGINKIESGNNSNNLFSVNKYIKNNQGVYETNDSFELIVKTVDDKGDIPSLYDYFIKLDPNSTYRLSANKDISNSNIYFATLNENGVKEKYENIDVENIDENTFKFKTNYEELYVYFRIETSEIPSTTKIKLEKNEIVTEWTPSYDDIIYILNNKLDSVDNQNKINELKSEIENSFETFLNSKILYIINEVQQNINSGQWNTDRVVTNNIKMFKGVIDSMMLEIEGLQYSLLTLKSIKNTNIQYSLNDKYGSLNNSKIELISLLDELIGGEYGSNYNIDVINSELNNFKNKLYDYNQYSFGIIVNELNKISLYIDEEIDKRLPYEVTIESTNGFILKSNGSTTLQLKIFESNEDITNSDIIKEFKWQRVTDDEFDDILWNNIHKSFDGEIEVTFEDVKSTATFICEVKIGDKKIIKKINLVVINEPVISENAPINPSRDTIWFDKNTNLFKIWNGVKWINISNSVISSVEPTDKYVGMIWIDTSNYNSYSQKVWNGRWVNVGVNSENIDDIIEDSYYWGLNISSPVIYKNTSTYNAIGEHSDILIKGIITPKTNVEGGFITITPKGGVESQVYEKRVRFKPNDNDTYENYRIRLYEDSNKTKLLDEQTVIVILKGGSGKNAIVVSLDNELHGLNSDELGNVVDYENSGTTIRVFEGVNELIYQPYWLTNGSFTVTTEGVNITPALKPTGNVCTFGDVSNMSNEEDVAHVTYTIKGKTIEGEEFEITKRQFYNKIKSGWDGLDGGDAQLLYLSSSSEVFKFDKHNNPITEQVIVSAKTQNVLYNSEITFNVKYFDISGFLINQDVIGPSLDYSLILDKNYFYNDVNHISIVATINGNLGLLSDIITITKLSDGSDTIVGLLTNENVTLPAEQSGYVDIDDLFLFGGGQFKIFEGLDQIHEGVDFDVVISDRKYEIDDEEDIEEPDDGEDIEEPEEGDDIIIDDSVIVEIYPDGFYQIVKMDNDVNEAVAILRATYKGVIIEKEFTITKSKEGVYGEDAQVLVLTETSPAFKFSSDGTPYSDGQSIGLVAKLQNLDEEYAEQGVKMIAIPLDINGDRINKYPYDESIDEFNPNDNIINLSGVDGNDKRALLITEISGVNEYITNVSGISVKIDSVLIRASINNKYGVELYDETTLLKLYDGKVGRDAIEVRLSDMTTIISAENDGSFDTDFYYNNPLGVFEVYYGFDDLTGASNVQYEVEPHSYDDDLTVTINQSTGEYGISKLDKSLKRVEINLIANIIINEDGNEITIQRKLKWVILKINEAKDGESAPLMFLSIDSQIMKFDLNDELYPQNQKITIDVKTQNIGSSLPVVTAKSITIVNNEEVIGANVTLTKINDFKYELNGSNWNKLYSKILIEAIVENVGDGNLTLTDSETLVKLRDGDDSLVGDLTDQQFILKADSYGEVLLEALEDANGHFKVYRGLKDVTNECVFTITNEINCNVTINNTNDKGYYEVVSVSKTGGDYANADLNATYRSGEDNEITITLPLRITKTKDGVGILSIIDFYMVTDSIDNKPSHEDMGWVNGTENPIPTKERDEFLWNYEEITYSDGSAPSKSNVRLIQGEGARIIVSIDNQYAVTNSFNIKPSEGDWNDDMPLSKAKGEILWVRDVITYEDGIEYTDGYPVTGDKGDDAPLIHLSISSNVMKFDSEGIILPNQSIKIKANTQNLNENNVVITTTCYDINGLLITGSSQTYNNNEIIITNNNWVTNCYEMLVEAEVIENGVTYGDSEAIIKLQDGSDSVVGELTNSNLTLKIDSTGTLIGWDELNGYFKVYLGLNDITNECEFEVTDNIGIVVNINNTNDKGYY